MARCTLILPLLVSVLWATQPDSVTYVGPDTVVSFAVGSGQYEIAIEGDDTLKGPCRLIATDTRLYLLDQFNKRVLCYDTAGSFVRQINTWFTPVDMAIDSLKHLYLLDTISNPVSVIILDGDNEIDRMQIMHDTNQRIRGILIYPEEELLFRTNYGFNKAKRTLSFTGVLSCTPSVKTYRLEKESAIESDDGLCGHADGIRVSSTTYISEVDRKSRNCLDFLDNNDSIREVRGSEVFLSDYRGEQPEKSRTFYLFVEAGKSLTMLIKDLPGTYYHTVHWRNVSIDCQGNVYVFDLDQDGKASILKWRPSP